MIFTDLPAGETIFVDANTLVYHFVADPVLRVPCTDLLVRIKQQKIQGFTSTSVVGEMAHRLMTLEAIQAHGWPTAGIAQRLRKNPAAVQKLTLFRQAIQEIPIFGLHMLNIATSLLDAGAAISQSTGLLTNDALVVAVMRQQGLANLASHDNDFDRVPAITRYAPI